MSEFPKLGGLLGDTYGGDGTTTFGIPLGDYPDRTYPITPLMEVVEVYNLGNIPPVYSKNGRWLLYYGQGIAGDSVNATLPFLWRLKDLNSGEFVSLDFINMSASVKSKLQTSRFWINRKGTNLFYGASLTGEIFCIDPLLEIYPNIFTEVSVSMNLTGNLRKLVHMEYADGFYLFKQQTSSSAHIDVYQVMFDSPGFKVLLQTISNVGHLIDERMCGLTVDGKIILASNTSATGSSYVIFTILDVTTWTYVTKSTDTTGWPANIDRIQAYSISIEPSTRMIYCSCVSVSGAITMQLGTQVLMYNLDSFKYIRSTGIMDAGYPATVKTIAMAINPSTGEIAVIPTVGYHGIWFIEGRLSMYQAIKI
jgi:hypothetical protein